MIPSRDVMVDGILVVDKPAGCTSHDVVLAIRRLFRIRKVGHFGTLDPGATGVLVIALGRAVRFFPFLSMQDKAYEGRIRLGFATDTYDSSGTPLIRQQASIPSEPEILEAMNRLEGEILQLPPPYSAKKISGKPMYKLARAGKDFERKPSRVCVRYFRLRTFVPPYLDFEARCSSGTYIRSLAHDLGVSLGCGAHLDSLRRTSAGAFLIDEAQTLSQIEESIREGRPAAELLRPLEDLLPELPKISLAPGDDTRIRNGTPVSAEGYLVQLRPKEVGLRTGSRLRLFDPAGRFLALAEFSAERNRLVPLLVIA